MKALLVVAAACAALTAVPAMAATQHPHTERVQVIPLNASVAQADLGDPSNAAAETAWARSQVMNDPALLSALAARGMSPDRVIDLGRYSDGQTDIYVSG